MYQLPQTGFLRLSQIIGNKSTDPPTPAIIPVSKSTWWEGVKAGRFPQPVKLGRRCTAWRVEDIRALIGLDRTLTGGAENGAPTGTSHVGNPDGKN